MTFGAEFTHLRAAISPELPDWNEIRLVYRLLNPHAATPAMRDALEDMMVAADRPTLKLAVNRLEAAFANAGEGRVSPSRGVATAEAVSRGPAVTPDQCRHARWLLGMTQDRLARAVGLPASHLSKFERTGRLPSPGDGHPRWDDELRAVLEAARADFTNEPMPGVRLRKPG